MIITNSKPSIYESDVIPPPLIVVIEDFGWWSGFSSPELNQPFRTGMGRMHCPEDYTAVIRLAKALKTQVIAGFVLCEWDRVGILRDLPSATWLGSKWRGSKDGIEFQEKAVAILNENMESIRLAMHGIGHEFWNNGVAERSEFHDVNCIMRDKNQVVRHIDMYQKLFQATGLETSFPKIYIPPALKHSFGNGKEGFQKILADFGMSYVITVFEKAMKFAQPLFRCFTEECGVTVVERGLSPVSWDQVSAEPLFLFNHPVIPLHWANILHHDPSKNQDVIEAWAEFLKEGARLNGYVFFSDALSAISQMVFNQLTKIQIFDSSLLIDISAPRLVLPDHSKFSLYLNLPSEARVNKDDGNLIPAGHIKEGLMQLIPVNDVKQIRIFF